MNAATVNAYEFLAVVKPPAQTPAPKPLADDGGRLVAIKEELRQCYERETKLHSKLIMQAIALGNYERQAIKLINMLQTGPSLISREHLLAQLKATKVAAAVPTSAKAIIMQSSERWQAMSF